ncbi:alkaline phosphatase D family protein [Tautonia sociabilis]|uniref:Alkaline phosphatase n=1 Tax=Tautonia sociabilis TaxID=2080755 RepID=A0A432MLX7_9BACT|nr:alkaline phosphatase D family protein [Tautonia sociabilis]RUL88259.1 alkaline phosphatase [Tautonia sociabilis]
MIAAPILAGSLLFSAVAVPQDPGTRQATGVKIGEVSATSAIIWMRLTKHSSRNAEGPDRVGQPVEPVPEDAEVPGLRHACPGAPGRVRVRYGTDPGLEGALATDWVEVDASTDFIHQFALGGLRPATEYHFAAETAGPDGAPEHTPLLGRFRTAPPPDEPARVVFAMNTCQMYKDVDHPDGFEIYEAIGRLSPDFLVTAGDIVYYDNEDPRARTIPLARYHWQRMYGFPRHIELLRHLPVYFTKDDHDLLSDDCWPGLDPPFMRPMTFADGLRLFREQVPMGDGPSYRTFRWGKDLQIWLVEGRDDRSPNTLPDGPGKTIWGAEQKAWLRRTMQESDATWKLLISPTPIVGPDRENKRDNHANTGFAHEGREIRRWLAEHLPENAFILCGDRHWQYHSVDPETGVQEFSVGAASDEHAGGSPGLDPEYHRFHRLAGGFLLVVVDRPGGSPTIAFQHRDVDGAIVYESVARSPE